MKGERLRGWRKIAGALWDAPNDPQIYGAMELDAAPVVAAIERARARGHHLTPTHFVGRAVARALVAVPELNVRLLSERAYPRPSIDVFFITMVDKGRDLSGVKITRADQKSVLEVARELRERSQRMKAGNDPDLAKSKRTMEVLPRPVLRVALKLAAWVAGDHAQSIAALGLAESPFGSAMVTSVGMFGLPMGFAPLAWMYKVPLLVLVGEISDKPAVVAGQVVAQRTLPVTFTIDHRYVDGAHLGNGLRAFREYLAHPETWDPELAAPPAGA